MVKIEKKLKKTIKKQKLRILSLEDEIEYWKDELKAEIDKNHER